MLNPILAKNYVAEAAITKFRIVKFGTADGQVVVAAADTDSLIGVLGSLDAAITERCDIHRIGIAEVEYGATVVRGALLMTDSSGRAITATTGKTVIGVAEVSGVLGDIGSVNLNISIH